MQSSAPQEVLVYARQVGLAVDHRAHDPLIHLENYRVPELQDEEAPIFHPEFYREPVVATQLCLTQGALRCLAEATKEQPLKLPSLDPYRVRKLKVELPLLATDNDLDMMSFSRKITPDLANEALPREQVDLEKDEGLEWPSWSLDLPRQVMSHIDKQSLSITREAATHLYQCTRAPDWDGINNSIGSTGGSLFKVVPEPTTPMLPPRSPDPIPAEPWSDVGNIDLLSEKTSHISAELRELDHELLGNLGLSAHDCETLDSKAADPLSNFLDFTEPLTPTMPKIDYDGSKSKVEVPMTPPTTGSTHPFKKRVSFKAAMAEIIPQLPSPIPRPSDDRTSSESLECFFEQEIRPIAEMADRNLGNAHFHEADVLNRVPVPTMDFSCPKVPWDVSHRVKSGNAKKSKQRLKEAKQEFSGYGKWPIDLSMERNLRWVPFPAKLAQMAGHETIPEDISLDQWLCDPGQGSLFQPAHMSKLGAIQNNPTSDDKIDPADIDEPSSLWALTKKRKHQLGRAQIPQAVTEVDQVMPDLHESLDSKGLLDSFDSILESKHHKAKRNKQSEVVGNPSKAPKPDHECLVQMQTHSEDLKLSETCTLRPAPLPGVSAAVEGAIMLSSTVIVRRHFLSQIKKLLPNIMMVERDFESETVHADHSQFYSQGTVEEADLILNPGTGVLLTSIQKLHQRPLPGREASSKSIRSRVLRVAPRYSTLVILVSQNIKEGTAGSQGSESDSNALCSFTSFARSQMFTSLEVDVQVLYVPDGESALAHWTASLIAKHATPQSVQILVQVATSWEVWLSRGGLNSFAAQAILHLLKKRDDGERGSGRVLMRFLSMTAQEHAFSFKKLGIGEALLRRVSSVLAAKWKGV